MAYFFLLVFFDRVPNVSRNIIASQREKKLINVNKVNLDQMVVDIKNIRYYLGYHNIIA